MDTEYLLKKCKRIFKKQLKLNHSIKFKQDSTSYKSNLLYYRIIEYLTGFFIFSNTKLNSATYPLLRSAFEASVSLNNLRKYEDYGLYMEYDFNKEKISLLNYIKRERDNLGDIYKANTDLINKLDTVYLETTNKQAVLCKKNPDLGKTYGKFFNNVTKSDYGKLGYLIYKFLCNDSHNNLSSLINNTININYQVIRHNTISENDMLMILDAVSLIMYHSLIDSKPFISKLNEKDYKLIFKNIESIRNSLETS